MLQLIYGKSGTGKSTLLYKDIQENSNKDKIFMIVPEQSNLSTEQNLMKYLGTGVLLNIEVLTLSRMAQRVLNEVGENSQISLSKSRKSYDNS